MLKPVAYFVIGIFAGLTISLLMKDAKPVNRIDFYDSYRLRYKHPPRYPYGYDYYYAVQPMQHRGSGQKSNTQNDESRGNSGGSTEQGETHTNVRQVNDRVKRN